VKRLRLLSALLAALGLLTLPGVASAQAARPGPASAHPARAARPADDPAPPDPTPGTLSTATPSVAQGTPITFSYATSTADFLTDDWIGIYSDPGCGPVDGSYVCASTTYQYTPTASGTLTFATGSLAPGTYVAYYLYADEYHSLASPVTFTVSAAPFTPTGTLSTATPKVTEGQPLTFSYATTEADFSDTNWIGFYSDPGCGPVDGSYVCGSTTYLYTPTPSGTLTFDTASLAPGRYIALYLYDNEYTSLTTPVPFTVTAVAPVAAPSYAGVQPAPGLDDPQAVAQGPGGYYWVAETGDNRVVELSPKGREVMSLGGTGGAPSELRDPRAVAVDPAGRVWVADTGNNRVEEWATNGTFVGTIGGYGTGPGRMDEPEGVAEHGNRLWVSDDGNNRIESFSASTHAYESSRTTDVSAPAGLAFDAEGDLWAAQQGQTDTAEDGVVEFSPSGRVLTTIGGNDTELGGQSDTADVAVDAAGHVFVAQPDLDLIQEFTAGGVFLNEFGLTGAGALDVPTALIVTHAGRVLVADSGNDRLVTFAES
jgi:hypothetical protein